MSVPTRGALLAILELARWAPSGDNTQPWRFQVLADDHLVVHGRDTRDHCVYDLDGHASQLSLGILLETIRIAASGFGLEARIERRLTMAETLPTFDVRFLPSDLQPSELIECITTRSVQRRPLSTRRLTAGEKRALETCVGAGYRVGWRESLSERLRVAHLLSKSAKLRLTLPEAFAVHRAVIEPNARFSTDRIPDEAVGLDPLTIKIMHWSMQDWRRMSFLNKYLGGTLAPRMQLDFIPALACAAHVYVYSDVPPRSLDDFIAAGAAVQRLWLTLTHLGLRHQPAMTPLIFSRYARERRIFSAEPWAAAAAVAIDKELQKVLTMKTEGVVWLGRVGQGRATIARSLRQPLKALLT